jgi:DNA-binding winged helix-turn-helix (wHTH) protein/TolB-like protein
MVQFEQFRLDRRTRRLLRGTKYGEYEPVSLGSRAMAVLCALTDRNGDLLSKDEIMAAVWPGTVVEESNLTVQISALRRVLDQGRCDGSCIQTVAGRGYRFIPALVPVDEPPAKPDTPAQSDSPGPPPRHKIKAIVGGAVVISAFLATGAWWMLQSSSVPSILSANGPAQPPDWRQSIIIFPFEDSGGYAGPDSPAAEITREVTARVVRGQTGPVVTGATDKPTGLRAVGLQHDVHFVLTGNAQHQDGRLIVAANLYETASGQPVWGRQFDVPDGQGALTTIAQVIYENWWQASVDVEAWHAAHDHPDHLDKRDLLLMALATPLGTPTKAHYLERMSLVGRALALDPNYFVGLERQARLHAEFVLLGYSSDPVADLAIADQAIDHALTINPNSLNSLRAKATVLRAYGDWPAAEAVLRRVLTLQPTEANRHSELGQCLMAEGRHQEALVSFQTARRFAGGADPVYSYDANIALANLAVGELNEAITAAQLAIGEMPPDTGRIGELPWLALIAATALSGNDKAARADLQKFLSTPRSWHSMVEVQKRLAFVANPKLLDGLRSAGMPE